MHAEVAAARTGFQSLFCSKFVHVQYEISQNYGLGLPVEGDVYREALNSKQHASWQGPCRRGASRTSYALLASTLAIESVVFRVLQIDKSSSRRRVHHGLSTLLSLRFDSLCFVNVV